MHTLPDLEYNYDALEPYIDAKTMEIHHGKHHAGYVKKLNDALEGTDLEDKDVVELLADNLAVVSDKIKDVVRNNAGGHANHSLFWQIMGKPGTIVSGKLKEAIENDFGSFADFKKEFTKEAMARFGSGWVWLVVNDGKLEIISTGNQDSPLSDDKKPVLCLDVWEHAYYLKYQNLRNKYIDAFWNVVNWNKVGEFFESLS